ncbi:MAG: DUF308 domain-containing protein [Bacilli bacterium]|nr:DUF308 domain-containing protein [Bacilli bacterium]
MKTLFAKHKWMQLIYGALLLAAGILVIVFAINDKDNISKWLSIITSISLFIYAAALLFTGVFSLKEKLFDLAFIYSVVFIAVGVVLLCNQEMIGKFITIFVATLITAMGVVEIGEATSMVFFKRPVFFIVLFYILGAAFIALGVLAFCFQEQVEQIVYVGIGILLCLTAVLELILGFHGLILASKVEKFKKAHVVDAEVVDKEEEKPAEEAKKEEEKPVNELEFHDAQNDNHDNSKPDA